MSDDETTPTGTEGAYNYQDLLLENFRNGYAAAVAQPPLITDAMIERAAKALFASEEPDRNTWRWDKKNPMTPDDPHGWHEYWLDAAQVALEAALNGGDDDDS